MRERRIHRPVAPVILARLVILALLAILAILATLLTVGIARASDPVEERPLEPGGTIILECEHGGSATIEGWDRDVVRITWSDRQHDADVYDVDIREKRDGIEITADWADRHYDSNSLKFEIMAPHEVSFEFESAGGGLKLIGLEGEFSGRTGGGSLVLKDVKGEADLRSGGGTIEILDSELDGKVTTGGGKAMVRNVVGDVVARSGGGNVQYKNVRDRDGNLRSPSGRHATVTGTGRTILISSAGGAIELDEAPDGASVKTGGGDIEIENAARFVQATTGGGEIEIETESGPVEARTGAGDIHVTITKDSGENEGDVDLSTGTGDVTLIVPKGYSMDLDLQIGYTRNSNRDYRIITDLKFEEKRTDEWDYDHGSPRKFIYGTGKVAGGAHRIEIRTTNGNIRIEER